MSGAIVKGARLAILPMLVLCLGCGSEREPGQVDPYRDLAHEQAMHFCPDSQLLLRPLGHDGWVCCAYQVHHRLDLLCYDSAGRQVFNPGSLKELAIGVDEQHDCPAHNLSAIIESYR